jgi:predicted transcriptional regulator
MKRLSKLQKWILIEAAKQTDMQMLFQLVIIDRYYGRRTASAEAAVSRSVWSLIDNGYMRGLAPVKASVMAMAFGAMGKSLEEFKERYGKFKPNEKVAVPAIKNLKKAKVVMLTDKGREKVKQLLNVK